MGASFNQLQSRAQSPSTSYSKYIVDSLLFHSCSLVFHSCSLVFHSCSLVFHSCSLVFTRAHSCSLVFTCVHSCSDSCGVLDQIDCERSVLSAGLDFRARERKGGTAAHNAKFPLVEIDTPVSQI